MSGALNWRTIDYCSNFYFSKNWNYTESANLDFDVSRNKLFDLLIWSICIWLVVNLLWKLSKRPDLHINMILVTQLCIATLHSTKLNLWEASFKSSKEHNHSWNEKNSNKNTGGMNTYLVTESRLCLSPVTPSFKCQLSVIFRTLTSHYSLNIQSLNF